MRKTDDGSASILETIIPSIDNKKKPPSSSLLVESKKHQNSSKKSANNHEDQSYLIDVFKTIIKDELKKHSASVSTKKN